MTRPRSWAMLIGAATFVLCGCGKAGGGAASSQAASSSAPSAAVAAVTPAAPSDTVASSATASVVPPAATASVPIVTPAAAPAPPRREPTAAELLRNDPAYIARGKRIDALYQNARERDPTGQVDHEQAAALAELHACADRACLDRWFSRREAALRQYVEN